MITDYMATEGETKKHPEAFETIQKASNGNVNAAIFMWSFWNFAHIIDDLVDKQPLPETVKEQMFKGIHDFVTDLLMNPFVKEHAPQIHIMLAQTMARCLDGDALEKANDPGAAAVRCGDVDFIMQMGYLAGGWQKLRDLKDNRKYDTKD